MAKTLKEFSINLPMVDVTPMGAMHGAPEVSTSYAPVDVTRAYDIPADIDKTQCSHITVCVDSAQVTSYDETCPTVEVDLVLNICMRDPQSGQSSSYKLIKRLCMDKIKLACQAEHETPYQVLEAITPEQEAKKLSEQQAAQRARVLAGIVQ